VQNRQGLTLKKTQEIQQTQIPHLAISFYHYAIKKVFFVLSLILVIYPAWAQETLTYMVEIVDRSKPDYPAINRTIIINANFTGTPTKKQQLQITEIGLDEMQLQAQLFVNGVKQGDEISEENAKIQYQGVCHNPVTQQANAIFYLSGNAASVDTSEMIALQFDNNKLQIQAVTATDGPYYFGDSFDLLKCEAGQVFTPEAGTYRPCSCKIS